MFSFVSFYYQFLLIHEFFFFGMVLSYLTFFTEIGHVSILLGYQFVYVVLEAIDTLHAVGVGTLEIVWDPGEEEIGCTG